MEESDSLRSYNYRKKVNFKNEGNKNRDRFKEQNKKINEKKFTLATIEANLPKRWSFASITISLTILPWDQNRVELKGWRFKSRKWDVRTCAKFSKSFFFVFISIMLNKDRKLEGQSTKRRVWDRDEYAQKAQEREAAQRITEVPKSMFNESIELFVLLNIL